jgi:hypothetical protein
VDGGSTEREESDELLRRLERIEALEQERAAPGRLLGELRELVREAEAWSRAARNFEGRRKE